MEKNINNVGRLEALIMFFGSLVASAICKNIILSIIFSVLALVNAVIYLILLYSKKIKKGKDARDYIKKLDKIL